MNVRKFTAQTSREALRLVREALGPDALILSNRNIDGNVEIMALTGEELPAPVEPRDQPVAAAHVGDLSAVMSEIRSMRSMLETQFTEMAGGVPAQREPKKPLLVRELLAAGFSPGLAQHLSEQLPARESGKGDLARAQTILARNLMSTGGKNKFLEKGGTYALVGPTGVGKTTTTAKLAARCVMRHGSGKLALITTDSYRIGAYEQLRIYGKILGVMVHAVKDEADLRIALAELKNKHTILIDTVGMSQRDRMVAEQVALLSGAGTEVKRLLCLNATSTAETLNEVVRAYEGTGLAGCIITKLDEAASIGAVLDVIIRHKLNLYCVADGQRVPEDLHLANPRDLVKRAFALKNEAVPAAPGDAGLSLVIARKSSRKNLHEVHLG
ncbi:MAG: flagellar biosynthesis protein FlhF [Pseudomonadota bacterium]